MTLPAKICVLLSMIAGLIFFTYLPARSAELAGEHDLMLGIRDAQNATRAEVSAAERLDSALEKFGPAYAIVRKQADTAGYWEDACRSTPECGGKAP